MRMTLTKAIVLPIPEVADETSKGPNPIRRTFELLRNHQIRRSLASIWHWKFLVIQAIPSEWFGGTRVIPNGRREMDIAMTDSTKWSSIGMRQDFQDFWLITFFALTDGRRLWNMRLYDWRARRIFVWTFWEQMMTNKLLERPFPNAWYGTDSISSILNLLWNPVFGWTLRWLSWQSTIVLSTQVQVVDWMYFYWIFLITLWKELYRIYIFGPSS